MRYCSVWIVATIHASHATVHATVHATIHATIHASAEFWIVEAVSVSHVEVRVGGKGVIRLGSDQRHDSIGVVVALAAIVRIAHAVRGVWAESVAWVVLALGLINSQGLGIWVAAVAVGGAAVVGVTEPAVVTVSPSHAPWPHAIAVSHTHVKVWVSGKAAL